MFLASSTEHSIFKFHPYCSILWVLYSFIWLNNIPCIHPLMDIWVVSRYLTIVNSATMNICMQVFVWVPILYCLGHYLGVELLGHMVILYLAFWRMSNCFTQWCIILQPHQQCTSVPISPHPHQHLLFSRVLLLLLNFFYWFEVISCIF